MPCVFGLNSVLQEEPLFKVACFLSALSKPSFGPNESSFSSLGVVNWSETYDCGMRGSRLGGGQGVRTPLEKSHKYKI